MKDFHSIHLLFLLFVGLNTYKNAYKVKLYVSF